MISCKIAIFTYQDKGMVKYATEGVREAIFKKKQLKFRQFPDFGDPPPVKSGWVPELYGALFLNSSLYSKLFKSYSKYYLQLNEMVI